MHLNLVYLGAGLWMIGTGADSLPNLTIGNVLKIVGGVLLIIAAVVS